MPYIVLNNASISRNRDAINRFILVSGIVDSPISPETPKYITSIEDLDLYFEKDFTGREYFVELIEKNVGLLLYKPVTPDIIETEVYFDYSNYEIDYGSNENPYCYTIESDLPREGKSEIIYYSQTEDVGPWIWIEDYKMYCEVKNLPQNIEEKTKSYNIRDSLRILEFGSLENISRYGYEYCYPKFHEDHKGINIIYPEPIKTKFNEDHKGINIEFYPEPIKTSDFFSGRSSFAYTLKFNKKDIKNLIEDTNEEGYYLGFTIWEETYLIWLNDGGFSNKRDPIGSDFVEKGNKIEIRYFDDAKGSYKSADVIIEEIVNKILSIEYEKAPQGNEEDNKYKYKYKYIQYGKRIENGDEITYNLIVNTLSPSRHFYNIPGVSFEINESISNQILSNHSKDKSRIEFFTKTIGNSKEKPKIKISKLRNNPGYYTIEISKYDYVEVFTGTIFHDLANRSRNINDVMLDSLINKESKIVSCRLNRYRSDGSLYKLEDKDSKLYTGEWYLGGGINEKYDYSYFQKSLKELKKVEDYNEDFLLIPNIDNFRGGISDFQKNYDYFPEYEILLDYAKYKSCQVLIENLDVPHIIKDVSELPNINISFEIEKDIKFIPLTIYRHNYFDEDKNIIIQNHYKYDLNLKKLVNVDDDPELCNSFLNNFKFNYNKDYDNYLVYFYKNIYLPNGQKRPGFYVFLENIITGQFETKKTRILYDSLLKERFLVDNNSNENNLRNKLEEYKSNFLSYNNHYYYYDQLFSGESKEHFSIITRFLIGKIRRWLESRKWEILSKQATIDKEEKVIQILNALVNRYRSIIKKLNVIDFNIDITKRTLSFKLQLIYSELINKDIYLNITINT